MKDNRLFIKINKPIHEVFLFTLNPENTPLWIDSIVKEEVSEKPTRMGTIYKNKNHQGKWTEYTVTDYEEDIFFIFTSSDQNYNVKYSFESINNNTTKLEYYEWANKGELKDPFTIETLNKLKLVLEGSD